MDVKILRRAKGYKVLYNFIYLFIITVSYFLLVDTFLVTNSQTGPDAFVRSAFIFISPCALEGTEIIIERMRGMKPLRNKILFVEIIVSVLISLYLFAGCFVDKIKFIPTEWLKYILLVYPIRILTDLFVNLCELLLMEGGGTNDD